jgi:hypothetical protein
MSTNSKQQTAATTATWLGIAIAMGCAALVVVGADTVPALLGMTSGLLMMTAGLQMKRNASQCSEEDAEATRG